MRSGPATHEDRETACICSRCKAGRAKTKQKQKQLKDIPLCLNGTWLEARRSMYLGGMGGREALAALHGAVEPERCTRLDLVSMGIFGCYLFALNMEPGMAYAE